MLIAQDKVVLIHYTLTNDKGEVLDSSSGGDPLAYMHGQGNIIPGLEKALDGKQAGDKLNVRVEPAEGYGVRDDALVQQVPERKPEDARAKLIAESQVLREVKRWPDANAALVSANDRFPSDIDLLYEQAMMAEKLSRMDEMERVLRRVIELKPDHHHA